MKYEIELPKQSGVSVPNVRISEVYGGI